VSAKHGRPTDARNKLLAVMFRTHEFAPYSTQNHLSIDCPPLLNASCKAMISTRLWSSVSFVDLATGQQAPKLRAQWARAPSFRIHLPADFFYPFQTQSRSTLEGYSSSGLTSSSMTHQYSTFLLCISTHLLFIILYFSWSSSSPSLFILIYL